MKKLFKQQSSTKAAGTDKVSTSTLKDCANELAPVFTDLLNACLRQHTASIIPVSKKPKVKALNEFSPGALTSVVMKVLE